MKPKNQSVKAARQARGLPRRCTPPALTLKVKDPENKAEVLAAKIEKVLRPEVLAAFTIQQYGNSFGELDLQSLVNALEQQGKSVSGGDMNRAEAMLIAQAHTLDAIFNSLAQKAHNSQYLQPLELYLRLSLKAQSQCRATLETLAAIKNPPSVAFVRQANIANGPQQVNNGTITASPSRTRETENLQNELLEAQHEERMDGGTAGAPGRTDSQLETMGTVNGAKDGEGYGDGIKKR